MFANIKKHFYILRKPSGGLNELTCLKIQLLRHSKLCPSAP